MVNNKTTKQTNPDAVPTPEVSSIELGEQQEVWTPEESTPHYVVTRGGLRVSDKDYLKADEPRAIAEKDLWQKVINKWPDGTRIEIVQYDKKKHRIW